MAFDANRRAPLFPLEMADFRRWVGVIDDSPDEIIEFYPALMLEDVHTAIAYYTSSNEFGG